MAKQTSRSQLLKDIQVERGRLERNLSSLSEKEMTRHGTPGAWSIKDIIAHLVAWEQLFLDWYQSGVQDRSPARDPVGMSRKAIGALNQEIYENNRRRSLHEVLAEFSTSYQQVIATIQSIPEEDMFACNRFAWTGELTLADYIAGNTCNHYAWANAQIRKRTGPAIDRRQKKRL